MLSKLQCLLTPRESVVALIDYQPQMFFGIGSHERQMVVNNAVALAKAAMLFDVPVVLSTVAATPFSGALHPEIQAIFPDQSPIERTTMNSWEDKNFKAAVTTFGRKQIIIAGLWTEVCVCFPAVDAIAEGYEVYAPTDACGDITAEAHERAVQRAIQAGVVPMTTLQVMFEWQRDWARVETCDGCMDILKAHSAYGTGVSYAKDIVGERAAETGAAGAFSGKVESSFPSKMR
jgi:nicotinamidase-related amidase